MGNPAGVRRDFEALERRRFQAIRLLDKGLNQSEVARRVKVVRQTVCRWASQCRQQGAESLKKAGRAGRKPLLSGADRKRLEELLLQGPEAIGYETPLWTCPRVADLIAARRVKVVRQTVCRWASQCRQQGAESLKKAGRAGRKPLLSGADRHRTGVLAALRAGGGIAPPRAGSDRL